MVLLWKSVGNEVFLLWKSVEKEAFLPWKSVGICSAPGVEGRGGEVKK